MSLRKAILRSFNSGDYTATVQLAGSYKAYLTGVAVARNLPASEMALGRKDLYSVCTSMIRIMSNQKEPVFMFINPITSSVMNPKSGSKMRVLLKSYGITTYGKEYILDSISTKAN